MQMEESNQEESATSVEEICSSTWKPLYRFIYYKVQNREEAEDITQETYVKSMNHLQSGKVQPEKHLSFLKTVAMNVLRDRWRKKKRRGTLATIENIAPEEVATDDATENSTEKVVIENALKQLSKEQRTIIELRILKGYSVSDTAKVMNKKETNIRVIQYRALQKLAKLLQEEE